MKKLVLTVIAVMATTFVFSQFVQRNIVIVEIATGTWCQYCPGAAVAADNLVASGAHAAVIEYHNGDAYVNASGTARNSYYAVTGYPTAHFDGPTNMVGGANCPGSGVSYTSRYNSRYAVQSPLTIDISGSNTGDNYDIILSIHKLATITGTDLRAMLVLTETNISCPGWPASSGACLHEVNFVERMMVPGANGTAFSFTSGDMQIIHLTFTKTASWVSAKCKLIAFVQDYPTKTIYNGVQVDLTDIPAVIPVSFVADSTTGCAPNTVDYSDQSTGVDTYQWLFPGGTPSTSSVMNPSITYSDAGTYDATLTAWDNTLNRGNILVRTNYVTLTSAPDVAAEPTGDPLPWQGMTSDYTTTGAPDATSYNWVLTPSDAGTVTGTGTTGTVTWSNSFLGTAGIKVQGVNSCGAGPFSPEFPINLLVGIEQNSMDLGTLIYPNPNSGTFSLEMNSLTPQTISIEVTNSMGMKVYSENAVTFSGKLVKSIQLSNAASGVYFVSVQSSGKKIVGKFLVK
jgi:PKD repeat protein